MEPALAIVALGAILFVSIVMFLNELYYRKRVSMLGIILLVSVVYLMWYLHGINGVLLSTIEQLSKYQPVTIPPGE